MRRSQFARVLPRAGLFILLLPASAAFAQELEPRTYSPSPVGTHFLVATYAFATGDVLTDPSLPITNVQANLDFFTLGYVQTFGLAGHTASLGFAVPVVRGNLSGDVVDSPREIHRAGLGDVRLRFAYNLFGSPALAPEAFAKRAPSTSVGVSLTMTAPTGQYVDSRLVNVGANRWSFKPEIGISQPAGNWFFEASAGAWFFTDNADFMNGHVRSQSPLATIELHTGYDFRPGLWLAGDVGYYAGGRTSLDGQENQDRQSNIRYGITLSVPFARGWSAKIAASKGLMTRVGGNYKAVSITLQYRWFDH
ncbi:transporter [Paraburkholderia oxyphila]|uniref:transporter n=1 Tax=Paraburkholderia oxyphila TaxID=614212 RepID=UPI0005BDCA17|nr:transporter [Paraburkholderia oxyphila]